MDKVKKHKRHHSDETTPNFPMLQTSRCREKSPKISIFIKNTHVVKEQVNQSQAQAQAQGQGQKQEQHLEEKKEESQGCMGALKRMICGS